MRDLPVLFFYEKRGEGCGSGVLSWKKAGIAMGCQTSGLASHMSEPKIGTARRVGVRIDIRSGWEVFCQD